MQPITNVYGQFCVKFDVFSFLHSVKIIVILILNFLNFKYSYNGSSNWMSLKVIMLRWLNLVCFGNIFQLKRNYHGNVTAIWSKRCKQNMTKNIVICFALFWLDINQGSLRWWRFRQRIARISFVYPSFLYAVTWRWPQQLLWKSFVAALVQANNSLACLISSGMQEHAHFFLTK
jgi:hypothetical protein